MALPSSRIPFSWNAVDLPCVELLDDNRTLIWKYPEIFLCVVGLSSSYIETDVHLTFLDSGDEEMGLLDCVKSADPFKPISLVDHTIEDELKVNTAGIGSGSVTSADEDFVSSYVTPTPKHDFDDESTHSDNVRTHPLSSRFVILSSSFVDTDILTSPQVVLLVSSVPVGVNLVATEPTDGIRDSSIPEIEVGGPSVPESETGFSSATPSQNYPVNDFYESQTIDSLTAQDIYVPNWSVTNDAQIDNPSDVGFLDSFNINSAQHACMVSELRLRYAHEIMSRERLEKAEKEVAEINELYGRVSELEAGVAAKFEEVTGLNKQNVELLGKVSVLESAREELNSHVTKLGADCKGMRGEVASEAKIREEFSSLLAAVARHFEERAAQLDARIAEVRRDMDTGLYPDMLIAIVGRRCVLGHGIRLAMMKCAQTFERRSALGKVISLAINNVIQQGLEVGIEHEKAGRSLAQVEAYDPEVENKYVAAVGEFENVSFSLLEELEALKDSPLALIMSALTLEGDVDSTPELRKLQSHEMLLLDAIPAIHERAEKRGLDSSSSLAADGTAANVPVQDSSLVVADYQISNLALTDVVVPVPQPHDDLFDTAVLDKHADP
ncbi:hypothetical protein Tco_0789543 [Tanacetum coccineum]